MAFGTRLRWEELRSLAFGGIGAAFAVIGGPTLHHTRMLQFFNSTDKEVLISDDGITTEISLPSNTGLIIDCTANKVRDDGLFVHRETQFWVKQGSAGAPGSGKVTLSVMYADGGT
ncbi:MAG: hypothetical protein LLG04_18975 [Parachlamydia sp.]|jgi:hypothetical protein|nr:hypothetical protein [Parachlamydia sp.]